MEKTGGRFPAALMAGLSFAILAILVFGFLGSQWMPAKASRHAEGVDSMIRYLVYAAGAVAILGHVLLGLFIWKYRGERSSEYRPVSRKAEWAWALVPVLAMTLIAEVGGVVIGIPVWAEIYGDPPADAIHVEVVAKQFEWIVRYPGKDGKLGATVPALVNDDTNPLGLDRKDPASRDDIITRGTLRIPVDRAVVVRLRSHDVIHSFCIPEFRVKQDVLPGFTGSTKFVPTKAGRYEITCAEICGLGHYRMRGYVDVGSLSEYQDWLGKQIGYYE